MLMFVLGLLYFFRFHFVFLFVKSYDWWEVCELHKDWGGVLLLRGLVPHYMPWSLGIEISVIEMHKIVAESFSRSVLGS